MRVSRVARMVLLALHRGEHVVEHQRKVAVEDRCVAGRLPITPRQRRRIGERVELELLLPDAVVQRVGVGVRIDLQVLHHSSDDCAQQRAHVWIVLCKEQIRPSLGARVAQPLGGYVSGHDVGGAVGCVLGEPARVEQRRAKHFRKMLVRAAVVGRRLFDGAQLERVARKRPKRRRAGAEQRDEHGRGEVSAHYAGQEPCAYKAGSSR